MKLKQYNFILFIFTLSLNFICSSLYGEDVSFRFDKEILSLNETLTVELIAHKKINENPDFSPLEKDFTILSNSVGFTTKIINGKMSEEAKWTLKLMPKRAGELSLPPLKIGPYYTASHKIEVKTEALARKEDTLFIETEIEGSERDFFVDTPLIYTLRLFCREQVIQGSLSELIVSDNDAIVSIFDKEKQYEGTHKNGKRYLIVERKYSVIPQHEGELVFEPVVFEGMIAKGQDPFFHFQSDYKRVFSNEEKVLIKKAPVTFKNNNWFVADEFTIEGLWSDDLTSLKVSEPFTWTILLKAKNNFASQIPEIGLKFEKGVKHYVDKAEVSDEIVGNEIIGKKEIKVAIIPTKEGEFFSPEIKMEWWNLKKNRKEETIFPKMRFSAKKNELEEDEVAIAVPQHQKMTDSIRQEPLLNNLEEEGSSIIKEEKRLQEGIFQKGFFQISPFWILFSTLLGAFSFFVLILLKREKRKRSFGDKSEEPFLKNGIFEKGVLNKAHVKALRKTFKKACLDGDGKSAEKLLISLFRELLPTLKPLNLKTIKESFSEEFRGEVTKLYEHLYEESKRGIEVSEWNGAALYESFNQIKLGNVEKKKGGSEVILKELYP